MNAVDAVVLFLVALAALRGFRRGLLGQLFEFGGGLGGLMVGLALGPRAASFLLDEPGAQAALVSLATVFVCLALGQVIGFLLGARFGAIARRIRLGALDALFGAAGGAAATLVVFWLVASLLVQGPSRALARALHRSAVLVTVNEALPEPPNVLAYLRDYLDTSGFPQVFAGFPRPVGPAVPLPSNRLARRSARRAQDSVVRVLVPACGGLQLGSGWISAPETVVTNAHVVAGGDEVTVENDAGRVQGHVVLFDPATDVSVVHVEGLEGRALRLSAQLLERGRTGATLGYPGGADGKLVSHRAAVQARYAAEGLDIYGRRSVSRDVYELRSPVRQGDSGGPFVLPTGRVAGVIFAASTTDPRTGYALSGAEIGDEVRAGARASEAVSTGTCTT